MVYFVRWEENGQTMGKKLHFSNNHRFINNNGGSGNSFGYSGKYLILFNPL